MGVKLETLRGFPAQGSQIYALWPYFTAGQQLGIFLRGASAFEVTFLDFTYGSKAPMLALLDCYHGLSYD